MKANSDKSKQSNKATRRVLAGVLCGASVLSLVLSLVMPPISQAIANDDQTDSIEETVMGGGSSSESTDVDNTNNGDTENQNSDEVEGDETSGDAATAGLSSDGAEAEGAAQPADDGADDENAIAPAAENESTYEISSEAELSSKLLNENLRINGAATFKLTNNIDYNDEIRLDNANINITLNLNGFKIKHDSAGTPLFDIAEGATLTVVDDVDPERIQETVGVGEQLRDEDEHLTPDNYGKTAKMSYDNNGIPTGLTYYVTESTASGAGTTEKIYEHTATIQGAIVGVAKNSTMRLINVYEGGKFNLQGGTLTQKKECNVGSLIYAENGSTVNMSGGYVCGASTGTNGAGAGIKVINVNGIASTLNLTGGVIAGNSAPSGGGVYANGSTVTMSGGIISGNSTLANTPGYGGGIMAEGGSITVSGGFITNNKYANFCGNDGDGCHGGAGLAANNGAHVTISGGQITGNYSEEAGGGVYVTNQKQSGMAWLNITGGNIASNVSYRSEGAGIRVGQKVDAMINGPKDINGAKESTVYITNNHCMSRFDWGGGGIFVQGDSTDAANAGRLFVYNSYISSNTAGGYGGGVAVCPTGKTLVTNTDGTAIFGNTDAGDADSYDSTNTNNDGNPHLSGGGHKKTEDKDAYYSFDKNGEYVFRKSGHADFFLAASGHTTPVAVVTGKMLGDIDAKYSGSIELTNHIAIPANGAAQVKNSIGLSSGVKTTDETTTDAIRNKATTFITGNYSWDHGGGIMSNGNLYLGVPADTYVYPSLKLKATKELDGRDLKDGEFTFTVYRKDSDTAKAPSWDNNGNFSNGGCEPVESVPNNADGNIAFDLSEKLSELLSKQFKASDTGETTDYDITYYMVENADNKLGVKYDHAVYEIKVKVKCTPTELMSVPIQGKPNETKKLMVYNYTIDRVDVTKHDEGSAKDLGTVSLGTDGYYSIVDSSSATSTNKATFTNTYDPEVSWTPEATKVVEGGEMKEFTLQLAKDSKFDNIIGTAVTSAGEDTEQTLSFKDTTDNNKKVELKYSLSDIRNNPDDPGGSFKTFTYYVREKTDGSQFSHYTYDHSVYRFTVKPTYDTKTGEINCRVTYMKGTVNSEGNWTVEDNAKEQTFIDTSAPNSTDTSIPTFTNTYSTSLPLSGMSGVTLTYLAGAAVLCAAAAWMHIRRKANAKGGERRE